MTRTGCAIAVLAAMLAAPLHARQPVEGGAETASVFSAGNDRYAAGDYEEAARHYRQLIGQGFGGAEVHYNLGNALFKSGRLGPAMLEYEKAARLAPRDPDVQANIAFLRSIAADKTSVAGARTTTFFMQSLMALTDADQDAIVLTLVWLIMAALGGAWIVSRSHRIRRGIAWALVIAAFPLLISATVLIAKIYQSATTTSAIVLQDRVDVRSGPGDDNTILFTVHEGLKVRIGSDQGSWSQVVLENGLNGWVPAASLGII